MPDKRIFFIITICLLILQGFSQTYRIEGNLFDSLAGQPTPNAVISLLKQSDSISDPDQFITLIRLTSPKNLLCCGKLLLNTVLYELKVIQQNTRQIVFA